MKRILKFFYQVFNKILSSFGYKLIYYSPLENIKELIEEFLILIRPENQNKELIRIGSNHDGGYLVPNDLGGINYCFSPGVSNNSSFEDHLTSLNIECYLADFSVLGPAKKNAMFHFTKKYLGNKDDQMTMRLISWIKLNKHDGDMILQMDIEGAEYQVILDTPSDVLRKFRILVIEFHGFNYLDQLHSYDLISTSFYKLLNDFKIVHVHANNCCKSIKLGDEEIPSVMEFTFLRNDRFIKVEESLTLPHKLDQKNIPGNQDVKLPQTFLT